MTDFRKLWQEVESLVEAIAPESLANLNPPATSLELLKFKVIVPKAPVELLQLLALHNGEGGVAWTSLFPDGMQLMDIDHILSNVKYQTTSPDDHISDLEELVSLRVMRRPIGPVKPVFFYSKRVPFAHVNGELIWYFDLDPLEGGYLGQIVYEDAESLELRVVASSIAELLLAYISGLKAGHFEADPHTGQICSRQGAWYRMLGSEK